MYTFNNPRNETWLYYDDCAKAWIIHREIWTCVALVAIAIVTLYFAWVIKAGREELILVIKEKEEEEKRAKQREE